MKRLSCVRFAGLSLLLIACGEDQSIGSGGLDLEAIDQSISPCDDFYHFACGEWQKDHPVHDDGSNIGRDSAAFYATVPELKAIIRTSIEAPESGGVDRRIGDYFLSCMNAETNTLGRSAVAKELQAVYATTNLTELLQLVAKFRLLSSLSFLYIGVNVNPVLPDQYIVTFDQSGWELPDISQYLDPTSADLRMDYVQHMRRLGLQFGNLQLDAERALEVETALARVALAPEQRRDPRSLHHQLQRSELDQLTPHITWQLFFDAYGLDGSGPFEVVDPNYLTALDALLANTPLTTLQHYVAWQFMQDEARYLDDEILQVNFEFWARHFTGQSELSRRDWYCFTTTNSAWAMQLAQAYSWQHPDARGIDVVSGLVASLRQHFGSVVSDANWLDNASRSGALDKIEAMTAAIGYPEVWPDVPDVKLDAPTFVENRWILATRLNQDAMRWLGKPVNPTSFSGSPLDVNAYYRRGTNRITVPEGILRPPYFSDEFHSAVNFGALGTVIGHELAHGLDSIGRLFDSSGALRDTWSEASASAFEERSACLVSEYSAFAPLPGYYVNGAVTLAENIADMGGLTIALQAFTQEHARSAPHVGVFTPSQQFFLAYAQYHCENSTPELTAQRSLTDSHAPAEARVNVALANTPAFANAFGCSIGDPMVRRDPCQVW